MDRPSLNGDNGGSTDRNFAPIYRLDQLGSAVVYDLVGSPELGGKLTPVSPRARGAESAPGRDRRADKDTHPGRR